MDFNILLQALPLIGSAITVLIVFVKKGATVDINLAQLRSDMLEMKSDVKKLLLDVAVLKEKMHGRYPHVEDDSKNDS